jgi:hypothetical protein
MLTSKWNTLYFTAAASTDNLQFRLQTLPQSAKTFDNGQDLKQLTKTTIYLTSQQQLHSRNKCPEMT